MMACQCGHGKFPRGQCRWLAEPAAHKDSQNLTAERAVTPVRPGKPLAPSKRDTAAPFDGREEEFRPTIILLESDARTSAMRRGGASVQCRGLSSPAAGREVLACGLALILLAWCGCAAGTHDPGLSSVFVPQQAADGISLGDHQTIPRSPLR